MKHYVYVVTGLDLGWDCVVGVYCVDKVSLSDLQEEWPVDAYVITKRDIETKILS